MKVLFLGNPNKAHVRRWAEYLHRQGIAISLISDAPPPADFTITTTVPHWGFLQNLWTYRIRRGPHATARDKWRVYTPIVEREGPDIIHAHEALVYGPVLPHFTRYRRVLTPWGPDMEWLRSPGAEEARLVRQAVQAADIVTTNAPGMEEQWAGLAGVPRDRFQLFSWGVDLSIFYTRPESEQKAIRTRLGLCQDAPLVLSPRLAKPLYRIPTLIEGWARARREAGPQSRLKNAQFVVLRAGATNEHWAHVQTSSLAAADPSIRLIDEYLSPNDLACLYSASSAVAMIPESDLLAMSLLEALACGAIPIVNDLPCYRTALSTLGSAGERAHALFTDASAESVRAAFLTSASLPPAEEHRIREANQQYVVRNQDQASCRGGMIDLYQSLMKTDPRGHR